MVFTVFIFLSQHQSSIWYLLLHAVQLWLFCVCFCPSTNKIARTHWLANQSPCHRRMKTSLAEPAYWTLFTMSRTRTSIPVRVPHPAAAHSDGTKPHSCLSASSSSSSHLLDQHVHWVPLFTVMAWEAFFSVMRTSARRNLIIFRGWDLLLDIPHSSENKLPLQLLKHLLPGFENILDFNREALK